VQVSGEPESLRRRQSVEVCSDISADISLGHVAPHVADSKNNTMQNIRRSQKLGEVIPLTVSPGKPTMASPLMEASGMWRLMLSMMRLYLLCV